MNIEETDRSSNPYVRDAMAALLPGRPFIQFTYSMTPPLAVPQDMVGQIAVERAAIVWANLPPMHVWRYRQVS